MTDPIKSIVEETLAAAAKATEGSLRSECSFAASEYVEKGPWFSNQKVQKHESFMAGAKWMLERLKPNNAEKLALIAKELSEALEKIGVNAGDKDPRRVGHIAFGLFVTSTAVGAIERARAIAAGKGDGG